MIAKKIKNTGATSCYIKTGIYKYKNELPIYKRVSTVNGYSIIKYYHMVTIFDTRYTFYEIDGLKSDFLIGYNLLKKIGAVIDTEKRVIRYGGKEEKLIYIIIIYNSPVLVVPKKVFNEDGTAKLRLYLDYKKLNEYTNSDRYPMQDPSVILSNLGKAKYFSTIDLESGFHQILMKETDIEKTTFSINNRKYEFLRMPFGLTNASRIFQRAMDDILREQVGKTCHVYG